MRNNFNCTIFKPKLNLILNQMENTLNKKKAPRITAWCIEVRWDDNSTERLADVPHYVSRNIDTWLDEVEETNNE